MTGQNIDKIQIGKQNLVSLYAFSAASRLWFDGGLWVLYWQHIGISLFQIGVLEAILHVVAVASDVPIGIFADRFGWKLSLACGTILGITYTTIALFAHSFWAISIAFAARGLQITFTTGSDASIAYESAVWAGMKEKYLTISGRLYAIALVSMGVAEAAGGSLAHFSWSFVYVAFTLANVVSFVTVLWIREPRQLALPHDEKRTSVWTIMKDAAHFAKQSRPFITWIALSTIFSGFIAIFSFYGQSMLVHAGWSLIGIGVLTGVENGFGALVSWKTHSICDRIGKRQTITLAGAVAALGLVLFAWLPGLIAGIGYLLDSLAINIADPLIDQGLNEVIPSEQRATLLSANSTGFSLFMIFFFPMFGVLSEKMGLVDAAYITSIVGAAMIVVVTIWWRREFGRTKNE